jgi:hypothetical protein
VQKYGGGRHATDESIKRLLRFAFWVSDATVILSKSVMLLRGSNGYANAPLLRFTHVTCVVKNVHSHV